jgi:hypothetical protein
MINSRVAGGIAVGEVCGRRDRGSNAASPSARYQDINLLTQLFGPQELSVSTFSRCAGGDDRLGRTQVS